MKIEGYMVNFEGVGKLTIWAISKVEEEDIVYSVFIIKKEESSCLPIFPVAILIQ